MRNMLPWEVLARQLQEDPALMHGGWVVRGWVQRQIGGQGGEGQVPEQLLCLYFCTNGIQSTVCLLLMSCGGCMVTSS
jgi:hypothetical protein